MAQLATYLSPDVPWFFVGCAQVIEPYEFKDDWKFSSDHSSDTMPAHRHINHFSMHEDSALSLPLSKSLLINYEVSSTQKVNFWVVVYVGVQMKDSWCNDTVPKNPPRQMGLEWLLFCN